MNVYLTLYTNKRFPNFAAFSCRHALCNFYQDTDLDKSNKEPVSNAKLEYSENL